jgi:acetoin utilization protein AcuB
MGGISRSILVSETEEVAMTVGKRMTRNPITIAPDGSVAKARKMMQREKIHRLPVVDKHGKLTGIVTEKDLLKAAPSAATVLDVYEISQLLSELTVDEVMTRNPISIDEDTVIEDAARIMSDNNIGGLPVTREGHLSGIITESDLFKIFIELFGARRSGIRATMLIPEKKGELASIACAIRDKGGNIISIGTFLGEDMTNALLTIKVEEITKEELLASLSPYVEEVRDIREI